jgi:hypothetical protein
MKPHLPHLGLVAALAALAACGPHLEDESNELPGTTEQSLSCSGMASGDALARGQSLTSCNGRATLAHQSDGNVVLYDQAGAAWVSNTYGQPTTYFVMQTDGNLVLYTAAGAVWSSGTSGNPGARLALQDDCNLIIYNSSNRAIWSSNTPCRINLTDYMINTGGPLKDSTHGDMQQTRTGTGRFWYLKNPHDSRRWERYGYNSSRVWLERDTTLPSGEGPGEAYDNTPYNSLWMPRIWSAVSWSSGRVQSFSTSHKYFNFINGTTCSYNGNVTPWTDGRHKFRYLGPVNMGGNLGVVDVAIIDRYHDLGVNPWNPKVAERFWFAKGRGWVRWEYWRNRTTTTDDIGCRDNGTWDSDDPNVMNGQTLTALNTNSACSKRRTFNTNTTAVGFSDVCTALVP